MNQGNFKEVRLIALDLDGTTLTKKGLTRRTKRVLEKAIKKGIHVVIATGRVYSALPRKIFKIKGLEYVITSNGAHITELKNNKIIYSNYIRAEEIDIIEEILRKTSYPAEIFTEGRAYIDKAVYDDLAVNGSTYMSPRYVLRTRTPVAGIYDFLRKNRSRIENINIHFEFFEDRAKMKERFETIPYITVTSSFPHNIELGGATTSKATAVKEMCRMVGVDMENVMACGDSHNDGAMIRAAGIGIAMENGEEDVKAMADFIAPSNEEEGVAWCVEKFALKQKHR